MLEITIGMFGDVTVQDATHGRRAMYAEYPPDYPKENRISPRAPLATHFANVWEMDGLTGEWVHIETLDGQARSMAGIVWRYVTFPAMKLDGGYG